MNAATPDKSAGDRRRTARFPFKAAVEVLDRGSNNKFEGQVTHLSLNGCHVNARETLSQGTSVLIKIFAKADYLEAESEVIYVEPDGGMGLAFRTVIPGFVPVLQKWLLSAMNEV